MSKQVTLEQVYELYDMLCGRNLPERMRMQNQPQLRPKAAFSVIWFLQEHMRVIPDRFEQCTWCLDLFDNRYQALDSSDEWQEELGVTQELLKKHGGGRFCCYCCERAFWKEVISGQDNQASTERS